MMIVNFINFLRINIIKVIYKHWSSLLLASDLLTASSFAVFIFVSRVVAFLATLVMSISMVFLEFNKIASFAHFHINILPLLLRD